MPELKPCPFCGWKPELQEDIRFPRPERKARNAFEVVCQNPQCIIGFVDNNYFLTKEEAVSAWNRRFDDAGTKAD